LGIPLPGWLTELFQRTRRLSSTLRPGIPDAVSRKPRIAVLNATCLEVVEDLRGWAESLGIDLQADRSLGTMSVDDVDRAVVGADALILPSSDRARFPAAEHMARHRSVRALAVAASGYEWLDVAAATRAGIVVTNAPAPEGIEVVADHAIGLMLAVARQIPFHHESIRQGRSDRGIGVSLWRKTLGIVGLGNIGRAVARRARGFDMRILGTTRHPDDAFNRAYGLEVVPLGVLLRESDFVSIHLRLSPETERVIGRHELAQMKPSAIVINTARPQLVDEEALAEALLAGRLAGAGLDDPPSAHGRALLALPNVVFTPHLGNRAIEGMKAVLQAALADADAVLQGNRPLYLLNPEVYASPGLRAPAGSP
jgi:D-3-phosphoglycerate dehydrogenase